MYALTLHEQYEASNSNGCDPIWKQIWGLKVHPKAKLFLWRSTWNILPHGYNLSKKGIENVEKCVRCGLTETNEHALRDCQWAREVWLNIMNPNDIIPDIPFREWLGWIIANKPQKEVELFCICAWQIWCARNDICFEKITISPDLCHKKAFDLLNEFKRANEQLSSGRARREDARWTAPDPGVVKLNVDAAVNSKENRIGVGVVARNDKGAVLLAASKTLALHFCRAGEN